MRDYVLLYINGERHEVRGRDVTLTLSDYLRYQRSLTGTKVVCAEGDCGACSVLRGFPKPGSHSLNQPLDFEMINSCITLVGLMDSSHILTVEALREGDALSEIQKSMVENHGAQCGFCTPGFVVALTDLFEKKSDIDQKTVQNYLTGNLCRCTGYQPIIQAALNVDPKKVRKVRDRYHRNEIVVDLLEHQKTGFETHWEGRTFFAPATMDDALKIKKSNPKTKLISSATDLGVQLNKGRFEPHWLMSLHLIPEAYRIEETDGWLSVGAKISMTDLQKATQKTVPELDRFLNIFASPQIKNVATLIGNIANGSPIADTLPFLYVTNAQLKLAETDGFRWIPIGDFFQGYKKFDLKNSEIITEVKFEIPEKNHHLGLYKTSQRKDLDISCVNSAFLVEKKGKRVLSARIACGGVGPTVVRLEKTTSLLLNQIVTPDILSQCQKELSNEIHPRSDVRGTEEFRHKLVKNLFTKFYLEHLQ